MCAISVNPWTLESRKFEQILTRVQDYLYSEGGWKLVKLSNSRSTCGEIWKYCPFLITGKTTFVFHLPGWFIEFIPCSKMYLATAIAQWKVQPIFQPRIFIKLISISYGDKIFYYQDISGWYSYNIIISY